MIYLFVFFFLVYLFVFINICYIGSEKFGYIFKVSVDEVKGFMESFLGVLLIFVWY